MDKMKNVNIKYVVPVGSRITRKFYCPMLKEDISLSEEFTEQELVFNSNDLDRVDSGFNFSYCKTIQNLALPKLNCSEYSGEYNSTLKHGPLIIT